MSVLRLDVRDGVSVAGLLGALIEAGASLEAMEAAVAALGDGEVRLTVRGGTEGTSVRIRAPQGAPDAETWEQLRPRMVALAVDDAVRETALEILDALFAARAATHGVRPEEVDVDPFGSLDDLAGAIAIAAAVADLAPSDGVEVSAVGLGNGPLETLEGVVELPGPVVARLCEGMVTTTVAAAGDIAEPLAVAALAVLAQETGVDEPGGDRRGYGRLSWGGRVTAELVLADVPVDRGARGARSRRPSGATQRLTAGPHARPASEVDLSRRSAG